jgi:hypothetical protein
MKKLILILTTALLSCKSEHDIGRDNEKRDLLVAEYLKLVDSIGHSDPVDPQHKLLVAYNKNDTEYLNKRIDNLREIVKEIQNVPRPTSCFTPQPLSRLGFSEVYRFDYSAAFCDQTITIILGEIQDSWLIQTYQYKHDYKTDSCLSVDSFKVPLSEQQWMKFITAMERADFWGMKQSNGKGGVDGSSLRVTGYERAKNAFQGRYSVVYRWAADHTALGEAFRLALATSKIKVGCIGY